MPIHFNKMKAKVAIHVPGPPLIHATACARGRGRADCCSRSMLDLSSDGTLSYDEFLLAPVRDELFGQGPGLPAVEARFKELDLNADGSNA